MMNRPEFTKEQEHWICYQIGEWYLLWKDRIGLNESPHSTHRLGIAKEHLKEWLCGEKKDKPDETTRPL